LVKAPPSEKTTLLFLYAASSIYFLQNIYALPFPFPLLTWLTIFFPFPQHADERSAGGKM